jgi:hypothetical protein
MLTRIKYLLSFLLLLWLSGQDLLAQCSQCKAAAATEGEDGTLLFGNKINTGVLYLLALPVLLPLIVGSIWYLAARKRRREQELEGV